jgi:hypothetical protein
MLSNRQKPHISGTVVRMGPVASSGSTPHRRSSSGTAPERNIAIPTERPPNAHDHLGCAGAEGHDGQSDDERRQTQSPGERSAGTNKQARSHRQNGKTQDKGNQF